MSTIASVPSVVSAASAASATSAANSASQQTIALLQAQMLRYSQAANGQNSRASADYKALQTAIQAGNVTDAQAALARLQRDNAGSSPATSSSAASTTSSPVDSDGDHDGSSGAVKFSRDGSLNTSA